MNTNLNDWEIIFLLPNLGLCESVGNENIAIASNNDPRVTKITSLDKLSKSLVENFEDQFGRKRRPALLLISRNAPDFLRDDIDAIVGFRNIFALLSIIKGYEHSLMRNFVAYPLYSDYFNFYPITINRSNNGFITSSPSVLGFDDEVQSFRGQTSPGLANSEHINAEADEQLFILLEKVWKRRFIKRRLGEWQTRKLFRSLEMAYQATAMSFKNHSTIYDFGSSVSLWVSAFEILSHPGARENVNLLSVLDLLGKYKWNDPKLRRKAYKIRYGGQDRRINLAQKLYKELYDTRSDFLHGNPVRPNRLHPFKNKEIQPITRFAPLIYKVALQPFLDQFRDRRKRLNRQEEWINELDLSKAILKSRIP